MVMSEDEVSKIQAQQVELNRKLNEKISGDLSNFQRTISDILKQKQVSQENKRRTGTGRFSHQVR
jgi:hypothetical protein